MEVLFWAALAILAFLASSVLLHKLPTCKNDRLKLPPGPKPWPIIGNLHLIGPLAHVSFDRLSKKYGDIMLLKFGSRPVLIASSPRITKEILKTRDQNFCSRPALTSGKYTAYNYSSMLWAPYGALWRQARRISLTELFSSKQVDSYEYIRVEEMLALISRLYGSSGQEVILRDQLMQFTLTNVCRMVLGDKYFDESGTGSEKGTPDLKPKDIQEIFAQWFWINGVFNIGDWIPWLGFLDLQGYIRKMKILSKRLDKFHNYVIGDHMDRMEREKESFVAKDFVDVILQLAQDPNLEVKLTSDRIKAILQGPIEGGIDSSAIALEWTISELLKQPRILVKAIEELDRVIGRERWVEERDMSQLPYINAVVRESLRLH